MGNEKVVESFLEKIAAGQTEYLSDLLRHLADEILYTPAVCIENTGDPKGTNKIRVAMFSSEGRSIVPTFSSEEYFVDWSDGKHQCFSVSGADLALSLPGNTWLVLNPGYANDLELSPEQVSAIAASGVVSEHPGYTPQEPVEAEVRRPTQTNLRAAFTEENGMPAGAAAASDTAVTSFSFVSEEVCADLASVLERTPEVEEGYFEPSVGGTAQAALGLLTKRLSAERRFLLIDEIAEISRRFYGSAGAIEVYDDLHLGTSSSWELFKALAPFYTRETQEPALSQDSSGLFGGEEEPLQEQSGMLRSNLILERIRPKNAAQNILPNAGDEEDSSSSPWGQLRKKGSKLLGAFRLGSRD